MSHIHLAVFNLLFMSFAFVSTDSIDNLGGDEFDEDGGVGGAPKEAEGGHTSGPTEAEVGPTSGPTEAEGRPNFGPKEAEEASNSGPNETEIGTRAGISFSEMIFTLSLFKFADFVEMTSVSGGVVFSEIVFTLSLFKFADFIETTSVSGGKTFLVIVFSFSVLEFAALVELTSVSGGITFSEIVFTFSVSKFAALVELTSVFAVASIVTSVSGGPSRDLTSEIWIFLAFIEYKLACCLSIFIVGYILWHKLQLGHVAWKKQPRLTFRFEINLSFRGTQFPLFPPCPTLHWDLLEILVWKFKSGNQLVL
jgi:hypothetical protein